MNKLSQALAIGTMFLLPIVGALLTIAPAAASSSSLPTTSSTASSTNGEAKGWVVDRSDNICGLDDAKMLSKPCKVDYDALLKATPQLKRIKDDKIDPNSPVGIQLRQEAVNKVRDACDKVRQAEGYCSVWKTIRHTDGRTVADITDLVKAQL